MLSRRGFLAAVATAFVPLPQARLVEPGALLVSRHLAGVPTEIVRLINDSLLERCFHDSLFPTLLYKR